MKKFIIKTFDDREYDIEEDDAYLLIEAWKGSERAFPVDLGGEAISSSSIQSITPKLVTEADMFTRISEEKQIGSGKICRGHYSIQKEINRIIRDEGEGWPKKIQDSKYRNKIREQLRSTPGVMWCDYKVNECAC